MKRHLKNLSKRGMRCLFEFGQRLGFDVLPRHFYSEIPAVHELRKQQSWRQPLTMQFIRGSAIDEQKAVFQQCCPAAAFEREPTFAVFHRACQRNGEIGFGPVEANVLHAFVRTIRPQRIVQIGCGVSTAVILEAAEAAGVALDLTCVEPYPTGLLQELAGAGRITLVQHKVQDRLADVQERVRLADLFFVDSSHTLGPAGEVTRIISEILPHLPSGGWAHFHDIVFPYDYGRRVLSTELFFSHETALLHAFLTLNARFRIAMSLSMLHHAAPETIRSAIPDYQPALNDDGLEKMPGHFPSSIYLRAEP